MKRKNHSIRNISMVFGTALVLIEAFNRMAFRLMNERQSLSCKDGYFHDFRRGRFFYKKKECEQDNGGEVILFLHRLSPAVSADSCEELARQLSKKRTVYTMDFLGCGRSDKPPVTYVNFLYVLQITEMIEEVIGRPVHLVAEGNSASIAVAAAKYNPESIRRLTLLNPASQEEEKQLPETKSRIAKKLIECPVIGTFLYHITFAKSGAAHMGGETARYLYASIIGRYTNYDVEWMLKELNIPVKTVRNMEWGE